MLQKIYLPILSFYKDNIFNSTLDSLKKFFPIEGFPLPKETKYITSIPWFFKYDNYIKYLDMFNTNREKVDQYNNSKLLYNMIKEDLNIDLDPESLVTTQVGIFNYKYDQSVESVDKNDIGENYIYDCMDELLSYLLMNDKALSHGKDELKRMRISVTAMGKRLLKDDTKKYNSLYNPYIQELCKYYKFVLDTYQYYIEDKNRASKMICKEHIRLLSEFYNGLYKPLPDKLIKLKGIVY